MPVETMDMQVYAGILKEMGTKLADAMGVDPEDVTVSITFRGHVPPTPIKITIVNAEPEEWKAD